METSIKTNLPLDSQILSDFCRRWQIEELAVFGSALRSDFSKKSDVDFLVTYSPDRAHIAWGDFPDKAEMEQLLGRKVDWLTRSAVESARNPLFRQEVFGTAQVIYAKISE